MSLEGGNLAILCGAGLSMGSPTDLPSAAALTTTCVAAYESITGDTVPVSQRADLEAFASFLIDRNQLVVPFIERIVPWEARFQRRPNAGHVAIADLLLSNAIVAAVSTNYDTHIEDASADLGEGDPRGALDGVEANLYADRYKPLLKLHGCCRRSRNETVWHPRQLDDPTISARISSAATWLAGHLQGRDLLIVGFWSDWAYLNAVLESCVQSVRPQAIIVVNPDTASTLQTKAHSLWSWTQACGAHFFHEEEPAEVFLHDLRRVALEQFVRRLLFASTGKFLDLLGREFSGTLPDLALLSVEALFAFRHDIAARASDEPVRTQRPEGLEHAGAILLRMIELDAEFLGDMLVLNGEGIRLIRRPSGTRMSQVRADLDSAGGLSPAVDRVVCVDCLSDSLPSDIVRGSRPAGIVRGGSSATWMSIDEFYPYLGIAV
ncbi:MAG: SIR2 family protein [Gemmatimonadota bacterium]